MGAGVSNPGKLPDQASSDRRAVRYIMPKQIIFLVVIVMLGKIQSPDEQCRKDCSYFCWVYLNYQCHLFGSLLSWYLRHSGRGQCAICLSLLMLLFGEACWRVIKGNEGTVWRAAMTDGGCVRCVPVVCKWAGPYLIRHQFHLESPLKTLRRGSWYLPIYGQFHTVMISARIKITFRS